MELSEQNSSGTKYLRMIFATLISSGVLLNASYIYGLGFYQGYLSEFGFDYSLFPVEWEETLFWVYYASRALGVSALNILVGEWFVGVLTLTFVATYMIFMLFTWEPKVSATKLESSLLIKLRKFFGHKLFNPLRLFFTNKKSIKALLVSYMAMVFVLFLPIVLLLWCFFPLIGSNHAKSFIGDYIDNLDKDFCSSYESRYSPCIKLPTHEGRIVEGMIFARNGNLIGMHTEEGSVMFTLPDSFVTEKK